jgi:putative endonuclease
MMDTFKNKKIGALSETKACEHLQANGLKLIERNFNCCLGEIDIIMQDGDEIVFVEVRHNKHIAHAIESIDHYKQSKIIKAATFFLQKKQWYDKVHCRFDVVAVTDNDLEWIKDAFHTDNHP